MADVDVWRAETQRGLTLASSGLWPEAVEAFRSALRVIMASPDARAHEAQAQVATLLAQACRRTGQLDDAVLYAQQAWAASASILGEEAPGVARSQADLAIMLSAAGRHEEALGLLDDIVSRLDEPGMLDAVPVSALVDTCARVATHLRQPAHGLTLLATLRSGLLARGQAVATLDALARHLTALQSTQGPDDTARPASGVRAAVAEDAPLLDAVQLTDTLLRATPVAAQPLTLAAEEPLVLPEVPETLGTESVEMPDMAPALVLEEPIASISSDVVEPVPATFDDALFPPALFLPTGREETGRETVLFTPFDPATILPPPTEDEPVVVAPTMDAPHPIAINGYDALVAGMVRERPYTPAAPRRPALRAIVPDEAPSRTWLWTLLTVAAGAVVGVLVWLLRTGRLTLPTP